MNGISKHSDSADSSSGSSQEVKVEYEYVHLKKRLGLMGGVALIVGTMIGNRPL